MRVRPGLPAAGTQAHRGECPWRRPRLGRRGQTLLVEVAG